MALGESQLRHIVGNQCIHAAAIRDCVSGVSSQVAIAKFQMTAARNTTTER